MITNNSLLVQRHALIRSNLNITGIDFIKVKWGKLIRSSRRIILKEPGKIQRIYLEVYFISKHKERGLDKINSIPSIRPKENEQLDDYIRLLNSDKVSLAPFDIVGLFYNGTDKAINYPRPPEDYQITEEKTDNVLIIGLNETSKIIDSLTNPNTYFLAFNTDKLPLIDSYFSQINFSLYDTVPTAFDCEERTVATTTEEVLPEIDYLAKDYLSFRQLMLNRLSLLLPHYQDYQGDNPADFSNVIVELLAYAADQLSYYQDAVATEAYLSTARQRISVKRHARLLDYQMHEGCNSRTWIYFAVDKNRTVVVLPAGTKCLSNIAGETMQILANSETVNNLATLPVAVFTTLYAVNLISDHNEINIHTWGSEEYYLLAGATTATLKGHYSKLKANDILLIEEITNPDKRHVMRLTNVQFSMDALTNHNITNITWHDKDALPFDFIIATTIEGELNNNISIIRGNMVLADHGLLLSPEELQETVANKIMLKQKNLTFSVPFGEVLAQQQPAYNLLFQDPRQAQACISLKQIQIDQEQKAWLVKNDLLNSKPWNRDFVIEITDDRQPSIRFGNGLLGKHPEIGSLFEVQMRVGNGIEGNVGADILKHVVVDNLEDFPIKLVRNPLPAQGGTDPEAAIQVRLYAPETIQQQQRCVILSDYIEVIKQHPDVLHVTAETRWVSSRRTIFIAVAPRAGKNFDTEFKITLLNYLNGYKLIEHELEIIPPRYVGLDIALNVIVKKSHSASVVKQDLQEQFSNRITNGQRGFFHPDNFAFGESVYLSQIISVAMNVAGVADINLNSSKTHFRRWSNPLDKLSLENEQLDMAMMEIAQVQNLLHAPHLGRIEFYMD